MRGILNRPTAHGEGCVKRFLDTGSTPVSSTKKQYPARKCRGAAFFFGGADEELNPFPSQAAAIIFCYAYDEGETLPLCSANASRLSRVARQISGARLCSLFASAGFKLPSVPPSEDTIEIRTPKVRMTMVFSYFTLYLSDF